MDTSSNDCSHDIVIDYIDIDLDTSKQIMYCEKCYCTFDIKLSEQFNTLLEKTSSCSVDQ